MTTIEVRPRGEMPEAFCWNAPSVYPSAEAWQADYREVAGSLAEMAGFRGRVGSGPEVAAQALANRDGLLRRIYRVLTYAGLSHAVDTTDEAATQMDGQAYGLLGQAMAAVSFVEPELLAVGEETLRAWATAPSLAVYGHYIDDLLRKQAHVRSAEVEELLGMLADPFQGASTTAEVLRAADMKFPPARTAAGAELPVTEGTLSQILAGADRAARRTAWEGYMDAFLAHKSALASNLATSVKQNLFEMRARRHSTTLEAALFEQNIPQAVYDNLLTTFRENLPTWHRYWAVRRRALGVDELQPYDIWAPLTAAKPSVPYPQAVDMIAAGLGPMGAAYVAALRRGCGPERWVDVYPNVGKTAGAFSAGGPGTYPFIVMSYADTIESMSTLAHELGHSMHSYLTWQSQPTVYCDYGIFVAEVASNFHQAMVRAYLLDTNADRDFQISVIEEAMSNFHRYFFIMPTLARFELEIHRRVERGEGLSADSMIDLMAGLFAEGYGGQVHVNRERTGITWATFGHLYADYYVFQYATGISAAHTLSRRVLSGAPGAVDDYLGFLKAGNSVYPLDALKMAGVDMTGPEPVRTTFGILTELVERLEMLTS